MIERHRPISLFECFWELITSQTLWSARAFAPALGKLWWLPIAGAVYLWACLGMSRNFVGWGLDGTQAKLVAGALAVLGMLPLGIILAKMATMAYSRLRPRTGLLLVSALPPTVDVCAMLDVGFGLTFPQACLAALAFSAFAFAYVRHAIANIPSPVRTQLWLDDPTHADELVRECAEALRDPDLTSEERTAVEANLASGLTAIAVLSGDDNLPRAYEILMGSLDDMDDMDAYVSAARLVDAMGAKASRTGDIEGYEEALRLMLDTSSVIGAGQLRCIVARARLIHATHLAALAQRALDDGRTGRAARLRTAALDDLLAVFEHSSPRGTVNTLAQIKFASLVDRDSGDLDAAIDLCRAALRRLWVRSRLERAFGRLVLCDLLIDRAQLDPARSRGDLREALRLCRRLQRRAAGRAEAMRRLPLLLRLRQAAPAQIRQAYRDAFDALALMSGGVAADLAAEWASWATGAATTEDAAEAHWCWIRALADDARRRPLRAEKERRLSQFLGMAQRSGACLIAAGRTRDAALAFDLGRAMLLTERMQREREGIVERLLAAGRADLAQRWRDAQAAIARADRAGFAEDGGSRGTMLVRKRRFQTRFTSSDHLALADLERLLQEVGRVPGCEDVDAPADYDDLRAAAGEGPIVYLSATAAGTDALIVTDATEPLVVSLEPMSDELAALTRRFATSADAGEVMDLLGPIIPLLWTELMQPVADHLAPGSLVTLITLGPLSLLPLHVAGLAPDSDGVWRDRTPGLVFRYAPNARVLGRVQAQARASEGRPLRVLTAGVPVAAGVARLRYAAEESAGVLARFGTSRTDHPLPATRAAVLRAMDTCGIWHFACHGIHWRTDPLESSLVLSDGRITLRAIFARPATVCRLVVLSACRTAAADEGLLDEVVSFPSALLESGVAGVVCAQSEIVDRAAMLLVLRFFAELAHDGSPPRALARAQAWLRGATNAEIHAALPQAHAPEAGATPEGPRGMAGAPRVPASDLLGPAELHGRLRPAPRSPADPYGAPRGMDAPQGRVLRGGTPTARAETRLKTRLRAARGEGQGRRHGGGDGHDLALRRRALEVAVAQLRAQSGDVTLSHPALEWCLHVAGGRRQRARAREQADGEVGVPRGARDARDPVQRPARGPQLADGASVSEGVGVLRSGRAEVALVAADRSEEVQRLCDPAAIVDRGARHERRTTQDGAAPGVPAARRHEARAALHRREHGAVLEAREDRDGFIEGLERRRRVAGEPVRAADHLQRVARLPRQAERLEAAPALLEQRQRRARVAKQLHRAVTHRCPRESPRVVDLARTGLQRDVAAVGLRVVAAPPGEV